MEGALQPVRKSCSNALQLERGKHETRSYKKCKEGPGSDATKRIGKGAVKSSLERAKKFTRKCTAECATRIYNKNFTNKEMKRAKELQQIAPQRKKITKIGDQCQKII